MKKIICLVLTFVMVAALTACGGNGGNGGSSKGEGVAVKGSKWAEGLTVPELESKEVSWLLNAGYEDHEQYDLEEAPDAFYQTWKAWEETFGVKVNVEKVAWDNFTTHLTTSAASGEMPDIVYGGTTWFPSWPALGLVQPIDDYFDFSEEKWNMEIMDQLKWDGKHYVAYAQVPENFYICYNKTKFELADETTPLEHWKNGTWNWTQFAKTAKNMTDASSNEYGYTGWNLSFNKCIYSIVDIAEDGALKSLVATPKIKRWFTEIYNLYHAGSARNDNDRANYLTTFPAGKDAMIHISQEEYIRMRKMLEITGGDEFGIAPAPIFDPNEETVSKMSTNIYGFSISAQAKNPKGAAALIDLYYNVHNNIENSFGDLGQFGKYLTDEEKESVREANKTTPELNFVQGFGDAQQLWNLYCNDTIFSSTKEGSVSSLLDSFDSVLNAELKEFSGTIK